MGIANPLTGNAPLTVNFKNQGSTDVDGTIVSTVYDYGDGSTNNGGFPYLVSHDYNTLGTYIARMTVTDNDGATDFIEFIITVEAPVPSITFNQTTGRYTAPAGSLVDVNITTLAYGKGSVSLKVHTQGAEGGSALLVPSLGYSWNIPDGDSINPIDSGSFTMPANGEVYFSGTHVDIIDSSGASSTSVIINNNQGPSQSAIMNDSTQIQ